MRHLLIFLLCFPVFSHAKTIFEPNLGLNYGAFSERISRSDQLATGTEVSAVFTALNAGFRYGITRRYMHVAAVVEGYLINVSGLTATSGGSAVSTAGVATDTIFETNIGLGIGYEWNIPLRTYIILGSPFSGLELSYYFSDTFTLGLKYTQMSDIEFAGGEVDVSTFGVAVTFPIEFNYPDHWFRKKDWE